MKTSQYAQATKTLTEFIDWSKDIRCDFANELFSKGKYQQPPLSERWFGDDILYHKQNKTMMTFLDDTTFKWEKEDGTFIIK